MMIMLIQQITVIFIIIISLIIVIISISIIMMLRDSHGLVVPISRDAVRAHHDDVSQRMS